jgi:hypothetical protein
MEVAAAQAQAEDKEDAAKVKRDLARYAHMSAAREAGKEQQRQREQQKKQRQEQ